MQLFVAILNEESPKISLLKRPHVELAARRVRLELAADTSLVAT